jgi:dipeptidyl aminopeptidase/acylaminoacyl peptidase
MYPFGQSLRGMGYNVLLPDLADAAGETVGNGRIAMGYEERFDVVGAFDYLRDLGFAPERIGLMGVSLGASTALLTAGIEPRIRAVWADSPYARPDEVAAEQAETFGYPRLIVPGGLIWGMLLTGNRIWEAAAIEHAAALAANDQAVQLVHCTNDGFVSPHHSQDIERTYREAGVPVELWSLECAEGIYSHAAAYGTAEQEYLRRLDTFFKTFLAD